MPIHDVGYRRWSGKSTGDAFRWWVIAWTGIKIAWKSMWLRRMLVAAWLPAIGFGTMFFFYEQAIERDVQIFFATLFRGFLDRPELANLLIEDPVAARHDVWAYLLLIFFRHPQGILIVLIVGLLAPRLISQDLRSRAHLLYFSRPITATEYILGKIAILWVYLIGVTSLPALGLYLIGISLSPDLSVVWDTWDLPLRIALASAVLIVPTSLFALAVSSLTKDARYAGFAWFTVWIIGWVTYTALTVASNFDIATRSEWNVDRWVLLSPYHILGRAQTWIFNVEPNVTLSRQCIVVLLVVTAFSWICLRSRIAAAMKA